MPASDLSHSCKHCSAIKGARPEYEKLLQHDISLDDDPPASKKTTTSLWTKVLLAGSVTSLLLSSALFTLSILYLGDKISSSDCATSIPPATPDSPVLDSFTPTWTQHHFGERALNESLLRQSPSRAVDQEWDRLSDIGILTLTRVQVLRLGKDPASVVRAPPEWLESDQAEGEEERFIAAVDGIHLVHCLDSMRMSLYHNYHTYFPNGHAPGYGVHLSHCVAVIAEYLMCRPSLQLITWAWFEGTEWPFADFDISRTCMDYEALVSWQDAHSIRNLSVQTLYSLKQPRGVKMKPASVMRDEFESGVWEDIFDD